VGDACMIGSRIQSTRFYVAYVGDSMPTEIVSSGTGCGAGRDCLEGRACVSLTSIYLGQSPIFLEATINVGMFMMIFIERGWKVRKRQECY
jgi:hypothetical protein